MNRTWRAIVAVALLAAVSGCGASEVPPSPSPSSSPAGHAVLPVLASQEVGVGPSRLIFVLADPKDMSPIGTPDRSLTVGFRGPVGQTIAPQQATFAWSIKDVRGVYIVTPSFPSAGTWVADFSTSLRGGDPQTVSLTFDVKAKTIVLQPGTPAPAVDTPTAADVGGDLSKISTDQTPDPAFYTTSISQALSKKRPFVLIFATPKFCTSAACGPTLETVKDVAAKHPEMLFIHVEPYKLQDDNGSIQPVLDAQGNLTPADATTAFGLQSEPSTFVVGADGKIVAYFELIFSSAEMDAAIAQAEAG